MQNVTHLENAPKELFLHYLTGEQFPVSGCKIRTFISSCAALRATCNECRVKVELCWNEFVKFLSNTRCKLAPAMLPAAKWEMCLPSQYNLLINWIEGTPTCSRAGIHGGFAYKLIMNEDGPNIYGFSYSGQFKIRHHQPKVFDGGPLSLKDFIIIGENYFLLDFPNLISENNKLIVSLRSRFTRRNIKIFDLSLKELVWEETTGLDGDTYPIFNKDIHPFIKGNNIFILFQDLQKVHTLVCYNSDDRKQPPISLEIPGRNIIATNSNSNDLIFVNRLEEGGYCLIAVSIKTILSENIKTSLTTFKFSEKFIHYPFLIRIGEKFLVCLSSKKKSLKLKILELTSERFILHNVSLRGTKYLKSFKFSKIESACFLQGKLYITVEKTEKTKEECMLGWCILPIDLVTGLPHKSIHLENISMYYEDDYIQIVPGKPERLHILYSVSGNEANLMTLDYTTKASNKFTTS